MKQRITPVLVIMAALLFPLFLNPVSDLIDWFSNTILNETERKAIQYFAINQSTYLTILSIEATALVAYAIYWMQRRAEKEKEIGKKELARDALFSTLVASLKEVHALSRLDLYEEQDYRFIRISEKHFEAVSEISGLTEGDISLLHNILKELECLVEHEKEDEIGDIRLHTDKLISYIMMSPYVQYKYDVAEPNDAFEMMNANLLSVLRKFDYALDSKGKKQYFSQAGDVIFEYDTEGKAIVYNNTGKVICHAFVDPSGIREGWAILYREKSLLYEGEWKNYKKHGEGTEYLNDFGNNQYISREGIWNEGNLWDGVIHDVLVYNDGTLIDEDDVIQINEQFRGNEAGFINDFEMYSVADVIVKKGVLTIDPDLPLREVKATYESKYGEVEWLIDYAYDESKTPKINITLNGMHELELAVNPNLVIDKIPLPKEIMKSDIPYNLEKYVTDKEIETYNARIPEIIKDVKDYNEALETYKTAESCGLVLDLSVINEGNLKANDIHIELDFPDEFVILEGSKDSLEEPNAPSLPLNPLDKAMAKMVGTSAVQSAVELFGGLGVAALSHSYPCRNDNLLRNFAIHTNPNYWTDLDGNTISVHCAELLHTRQKDFNSKYLLIPTRAGIYEINISVICEEYIEEDEFKVQLVVNEK